MISIIVVQLETVQQYLQQLIPVTEDPERQQVPAPVPADFWPAEMAIMLDPAFVSGHEPVVLRTLPALILHAHARNMDINDEMALSILLSLSELLKQDLEMEGSYLKSFVRALGLFVERLPERRQVTAAVAQDLISIQGSSVFTCAHSLFIDICLKSEQFERGWSVAEQYITSVVPGSFDATDLVTFFFQCGCIGAQLRLYSRAIDLLDDCISLPAKSTHKVMIDAARKRSLLCFIHYGQVSVPFSIYST